MLEEFLRESRFYRELLQLIVANLDSLAKYHMFAKMKYLLQMLVKNVNALATEQEKVVTNAYRDIIYQPIVKLV
jgi:hypothetical protein